MDRTCKFRLPASLIRGQPAEGANRRVSIFAPSSSFLLQFVFVGGERFQKRRARQRQFPEQIPKRKGRIALQPFGIVDTGNTRQLSFEMCNRTYGSIL